MGQPGRQLIVLDGYGQEALNPEVRSTIEFLASKVISGMYRKKIRLVLLDYPHPLPGVGPLDLSAEQLHRRATWDTADLLPCLGEWN